MAIFFAKRSNLHKCIYMSVFCWPAMQWLVNNWWSREGGVSVVLVSHHAPAQTSLSVCLLSGCNEVQTLPVEAGSDLCSLSHSLATMEPRNWSVTPTPWTALKKKDVKNIFCWSVDPEAFNFRALLTVTQFCCDKDWNVKKAWKVF